MTILQVSLSYMSHSISIRIFLQNQWQHAHSTDDKLQRSSFKLNQPAEPLQGWYSIFFKKNNAYSLNTNNKDFYQITNVLNDASHIKCKLCCLSHISERSRLALNHYIFSILTRLSAVSFWLNTSGDPDRISSRERSTECIGTSGKKPQAHLSGEFQQTPPMHAYWSPLQLAILLSSKNSRTATMCQCKAIQLDEDSKPQKDLILSNALALCI